MFLVYITQLNFKLVETCYFQEIIGTQLVADLCFPRVRIKSHEKKWILDTEHVHHAWAIW